MHPDCQALFDRANDTAATAIAIGANPNVELHNLSEADDASPMYTSGTTGRPKGVVHSHASLLAGGWMTAIAHDLGPRDRRFCVPPIYHINGLCVTVVGALVSGGSLAAVQKILDFEILGSGV